MGVKLPVLTDQPTGQLTDQPTDGQSGSQGSFISNRVIIVLYQQLPQYSKTRSTEYLKHIEDGDGKPADNEDDAHHDQENTSPGNKHSIMIIDKKNTLDEK